MKVGDESMNETGGSSEAAGKSIYKFWAIKIFRIVPNLANQISGRVSGQSAHGTHGTRRSAQIPARPVRRFSLGMLRAESWKGQNLERLALIAVLLLAASLRLWDLDRNGFANTYYSAAVRSMAMSIHNFLFVSFDPAGFVSVDKPPLALWLQAGSVKLLGFTPLSLLLPQALEGIASVALVYHLVHRRFDGWAALIAALALAISPICVAVDRYNNVDSCLLLLLLLTAWAVTIATERASRWYLVLAAVLAGLAFNTKMLAAFVVVPAFYLEYFLGAKASLLKRLGDLSLASVVLIAVSLSWVLFFDLTPPQERPYAGSSADNSMMSLSLGWNGFQRLLARRGWRETQEIAATANTEPDPQTYPRRGGRRGMGTGEPGPFRLIEHGNAGEVAWMLPLVLVGIGFFARKWDRRLPISPQDQALLLWSGWLFTYLVVLSFLRGSMHIYYWAMLAPPLAALTGIAARGLWLAFSDREGPRNPLLFPIAVLLTAAWQSYILFYYPSARVPLSLVLCLGIGIAGFSLFKTGWPRQTAHPPSRWLAVGVNAGLISLFAAPMFWSLTPILEMNEGVSPEASPLLLTREPAGRQNEKENYKRLLAFLTENHRNERYLVVAQNARQVAPIIIETGKPALALGGFMGRDQIVSVDGFVKMVAENEVRYVMLSRPGRRGPNRNDGPNAEIAKWVREHGKGVEAALWRLPDEENEPDNGMDNRNNGYYRGWDRGLSNVELYDLRPSPDSGDSSPSATVSDQIKKDQRLNPSL
jgi:4-amino-4-deoxy-L-arabinose transferase-like glycosyltransferase